MTVIAVVTSGGPHPAASWAPTMASQVCELIEIADDKPGDDPAAVDIRATARKAKRRLQVDIEDAVEKILVDTQADERTKLAAAGGTARLSHGYDPGAFLDSAVSAIVKATVGTVFESHFSLDEVKATVRAIAGTRLATIMDIERSWHADRILASDPNDSHAKAFRRRQHG